MALSYRQLLKLVRLPFHHNRVVPHLGVEPRNPAR